MRLSLSLMTSQLTSASLFLIKLRGALLMMLNGLILTLVLGALSSSHAQPQSEQINTQNTPQKNTPHASSSPEKVLSKETRGILTGIQKFYSNISEFQADFTQIFTYKIYGRKKISTGKVFFKKPGKMRWDYEAPTKRLFIADGEVLWVYEPEEAQVFKRSLSSAQLPVALRFMKGEGELTKDFNIAEPKKEEERYTLILTPKIPSGEYQELQLVVDRKTFEVKSSILVDPTGNTNHIQFADIKVNTGLPESGFSFVPPQGVRVIKE